MNPSKLLITAASAFALCSSCESGNAAFTRDTVTMHRWGMLPAAKGEVVQPGLAGAYSGLTDDMLVIGGGANFPHGMPWHGGEKVWQDALYARHQHGGEWMQIEDVFPRPLAYGLSFTLPQGVLCIGGCDAERTYADVFLLSYRNGMFRCEAWPPLPIPLTNMCGAVVDDVIYVAGGQSTMKSPEALSVFLALDTKHLSGGWQTQPPWPGPARGYAVAAAQNDGTDNCFFLFGGREYGPQRRTQPLSDAYKYNPRTQIWTRLDERGHFSVTSGSAFPSGASHIVLIGGSDGKALMRENALREKIAHFASSSDPVERKDSIAGAQRQLYALLDNHPGFGDRVWAYHTITNTLVELNPTSESIPVTTNLVKHGTGYLLTSGEISPGIRTPAIYKIAVTTPPRHFGLLNGVVIFLYFAVLVFIGLFFARRQKTSDDYFKGGGRLPWWAVGLSIFGTSLSAITFMAIPAKAYASDWSYLLMNTGIILVVPIVIRIFIPFFRKLEVTTAYEYLEQRFNLATRLICSICFILFQICRMAVVLLLPSIALHVAAGMDIFLCIALMGGLALLYTMLGGIEAVVWTDALQVVILLGGALFAMTYIILHVEGGIGELLAEGVANRKFSLGSLRFNLMEPTVWTVLIASFFTNITTYGTDQTMVQRYLTTTDERMADRSVKMNAWLTIPATLLFFTAGFCLFIFYKHHPQALNLTITDGDAIFPWFIFSQMPQGLSGLLIAGIFAAAMSTLSSSMNSAATAYAVDIHFRFGWSKGRDPLKLARLFTLVLGVAGVCFALLMATWEVRSLWDEFQTMLGLIIGGLGGLFLLGMLTERANGTGAMIGIAGSIVVQIIVSNTHAVHLLLYATSGFISCFVLGYVGSMLFPDRKRRTTPLTIRSLKNRIAADSTVRQKVEQYPATENNPESKRCIRN